MKMLRKHKTENNRISIEASINRYDRQLRTENWGKKEQKKLYDSKVVLVGSDFLGQMTLGCLAGLGVGKIIIMDNKKNGNRGFLVHSKKENRVDQIIGIAKKINPYLDIKGINSSFFSSFLDYENFKPDVIIETTNSLSSKEKTLDYVMKNNISFISSYCNHKKSIISVYSPNKQNIEEILNSEKIVDEDPEQGGITAGINAGMITDELRKSLFNLNEKDNNLEKRVFYNLDSSERTSLESDLNKKVGNLSKKRVLVVGAGAIGNYVALNLALSGFKNIDIVDCDENIEETNLNRQILLYGRIGEKKAPVLSERIREMGKIKSKAFNYKITKDSGKFFEKNKYDIIFGCLDNFEARYYLSEFAVNFKIPYIDGGTFDLNGNLAVYYPGKTACIKCKKNLKPEPEIKRSCGEALPGVVIPNIIIGSAMVGEAVNIFRDELLEKRFLYDSFDSNRFYFYDELNSRKNCECLN